MLRADLLAPLSDRPGNGSRLLQCNLHVKYIVLQVRYIVGAECVLTRSKVTVNKRYILGYVTGGLRKFVVTRDASRVHLTIYRICDNAGSYNERLKNSARLSGTRSLSEKSLVKFRRV